MADASASGCVSVDTARLIASSMLGTRWAANPVIDRVPPGLSGASVFRLAASNGQRWAIKCWPSSTTKQRVEDVHRVMNVARDKECRLVPLVVASQNNASSCIRDSSGRCWDVCEWLPGKSFDLSSRTTSIYGAESGEITKHVRSGAQAIASFHESVARLNSDQGPAPAVRQRIDRWTVLDKQLPAILRDGDWGGFTRKHHHAPYLIRTAQRARQWLMDHWHEATRRNVQRLQDWQTNATALQFVLRDVHREHILFDQMATSRDQPTVTGLIDFDAVRVDTPATDLARWAASFTTDDSQSPGFHALMEQSMAGYRAIRAFSERERDLADTIARSSAWISLANWVVWLVGERRVFLGGPELVGERMEIALNQVQFVDQV